MLDPRKNVQISLSDAVEAGIIDYGRGVFCYPRTGRTASIPQAIADGRIQARFLDKNNCSYLGIVKQLKI